MWEDPSGTGVALQSALVTLELPALRVIAGLVLAFALSLGCAWVAALACLEIERHDRRAAPAR